MQVKLNKPATFRMRYALLAGFGAVLVLMTVAGMDSISVLQHVEADHTRFTQSYLEHHHQFERIHALIRHSGSVTKEALSVEASAAHNPLAELTGIRNGLDEALDRYSAFLDPNERELFTKLVGQLGEYWKVIEPALAWDAATRRKNGASYLKSELDPLQNSILQTAEQIDTLNEADLHTNDLRSAAMFNTLRRRMSGVLGLALTFGLAVAGLSIIYILRLESESQLRYNQIVRTQAKLQRLSAKLVDAQEDERRSISRELHDEVGQSLSALLVDVGILRTMAQHDRNPEAERLLVDVGKMAENSLSAVRNMALLLRPSMLDDLGLVPALHWQAREVSRQTGIRVDVTADDVVDELPDEYRTCVYRVVQEALHNCSRHAGAKLAGITLAQKEDCLMLTIEDNGRGFDPYTTRGLGLIGMEERVRNLGGDFAVRSEPGKGTVLMVEIPVSAEISRTTKAHA